MRYRRARDAIRRRGRGRPPARRAEGDALRLREPRADPSGASPSTAARRCTPSTTSSSSSRGFAGVPATSSPDPRSTCRSSRGITTLDETGVRYRGHDVAELARTTSFEQVAELLWTGALPDEADVAAARPGRRARCAARVARAVRGPALPALVAVASALGAHHRDRRPADRGPAAARRRPDGPRRGRPDGASGSLAERLAACWRPDA